MKLYGTMIPLLALLAVMSDAATADDNDTIVSSGNDAITTTSPNIRGGVAKIMLP